MLYVRQKNGFNFNFQVLGSVAQNFKALCILNPFDGYLVLTVLSASFSHLQPSHLLSQKIICRTLKCVRQPCPFNQLCVITRSSQSLLVNKSFVCFVNPVQAMMMTMLQYCDFY